MIFGKDGTLRIVQSVGDAMVNLILSVVGGHYSLPTVPHPMSGMVESGLIKEVVEFNILVRYDLRFIFGKRFPE